MEAKMVYLVTSGCYSEYGVHGVYSTEEKAKRAAELYDGDVEPMVLDDMPGAPPGLVAWYVLMRKDGVAVNTHRAFGPVPKAELRESTCWDGIIKMGAVEFEMWAADATHAVKIANERRIIMLAENRWPADPPPEPVRV